MDVFAQFIAGYLVAEHLIRGLNSGTIVRDHVSITDAMRLFVSSCSTEVKRQLLKNLQRAWRSRTDSLGIGQLFTLLWDSLVKLYVGEEDPVRKCLTDICSGSIDLSGMEISRLSFSSAHRQANIEGGSFSSSTLVSVDFSNADACLADFSHSFLDGASFSECVLDGANFSSAFLVDADFSGASVTDTIFTGVSEDDVSLLIDGPDTSTGKLHLQGLDALGYLRFNGGITDKIPDYYELKHHPRFAIVEKIIERLKEHSIRQRRGLEQRGAARQDIQFSREFMRFIEAKGFIRTPRNRKDLVEVTDKGREVFGGFVEKQDIPEDIADYLRNNRML